MNKKFKLAIPFAVLALTCCITAGCNVKDSGSESASGGGSAHTHTYTEWAHDDTQHWKVCPDDNAIDAGSRENHEYVAGKCECGADQPVVDVTVTNGTTDKNGTVTISKTTAKTGDSVTVTVAPNEGYQLQSLTVNGVNVFGSMTGNTYEFTVSEDTTIVGVFEKIASSSVNAVITGKKYGAEGNSLAAGTDVTLSASGREDITTKIVAEDENLVIKVPEIAGDNWTISVAGYAAASINIPRDVEYTEAIELQYDLMESLQKAWAPTSTDSDDLSNQNDGKIVHTSGYYQWLSTKASYDSVAISANVLSGGKRQGVFIRFAGAKYSEDGFVMIQKENNEKISYNGAGSGYTGKNIFPECWDTYKSPLAKDEYTFTLVRDGREIYVFIDGEYVAQKTLPEAYATQKCYVGLYCEQAEDIAGKERTFSIDSASDFLVCPVTDETAADAHGTVEIDKPNANLNEQVTVTLTPETGYKIKDLKVNGVSVLSQMKGSSYTFTALKATKVAAEFEESTTVETAEITVNAAAGWTADGTQITIEQLGETWTGTVTNGKVTLGGAETPVALGTHTVYANFGGYLFSLGTVEIAAPAEGNKATAEVTLNFTGNGFENKNAVTAADPKNGELTYKLGTDANNGAYNNKFDIAEISDGGLFAYKVKLGNDKNKTTTLILMSGNDEYKMVVQNNGSNNKNGWGIDGFVNDKNIWSNESWIDLTAYSDQLKGDGLWLVLDYNPTTGEAKQYVGGNLNGGMRLAKTWTFKTGIKFTAIGTGNWFGGLTKDDTATVTLKYGATMQDIGMALEEKVTVTASVNDDKMGSVTLDATDGKYYSGTQATLTVTAEAGYYLTSIKVGEQEAVTEGWTKNGNVYTYTFTAPEGGAAVVATLAVSPEVELTGVKVNITDGTDKIDLGDTVKATLTPAAGEAYNITLTKGTDGVYTFGGTFLAGDYILTLKDKYVGYASVEVTLAQTVADINVKYKLTSAEDKGPREDASITVTNDKITIVGTQHDAFAEWGSNHNDNSVPYVTLNLSDEAKNAKNVMLEFNLKTSNQSGYFINGFGVGMTGFNGLRMLFADTGDKTYTPDGKIITAILNGRKTGEDNISGGSYCVETYGWIETLALTEDGVNMRAIRQGTTLKFYAENAAGEWVLIKFLAPTNGDYNNLQYVDHVTVDESALNDFRFIANGATWDVSAITVTLNPEAIDNASHCTSNITVTSETDLTGVDVVLTDKDDATKTYTVQMKKTEAGKYYIEGYFRAGNYNITVEGFTCTSAGYDESNQPTTALWIDNVGGQCWGITLEAETTTPDQGGETGGEGAEGGEKTPAE